MQVDRLLSIILILMSRDVVTGKELAEHFEVSLRTIYRDIDKISRTMVPIAAIGGKGGGFYIMDSYKMDKMFFSKSEIKPLLSMMRSLKDMLGKNESFNSSITKFENFYDIDNTASSISIDISGVSSNKIGEYLEVINNAIDNSKCVIINYTNRRLESSDRVVDPIKICFFEGAWYFAGFCRARKAYRQFKISRITNLSLGEAFTKKDINNEELDAIFSDSYICKSIKVMLKFSKRIANHLTEYFSQDQITYGEDGTIIVSFDSPNEEGLKKYILSFGRDCEVIAPTTVRRELRGYIEELRLIYDKEE